MRTRLGANVAVPAAAAFVGAALVWWMGLREFAFSDYEVEALPAVQRLLDGNVAGYLSHLPGYGGALILQAPLAVIGGALGGDSDLWAWRAQAVPGLLLLGFVGAFAGASVARALGARRGLVWGSLTALVIAGSPFAVLAEQIGHPEDPLIVGLCLLGVLVTRRSPLLAGVLVGLAAAAKPWALIAVPVVLVVHPDWRVATRVGIAAAAAAVLLTTPVMLGSDIAKPTAHASSAGIFKPTNLFWFAGAPNPRWDPDQVRASSDVGPAGAYWAQRLEPVWAARVSHPLIVIVAAVLALAFARRPRRERAGPDAFLLLAAVGWWRYLLDTWSTNYYLYLGLVALAVWEARRGRPPLLAVSATGLAWVTLNPPAALTWSPDVTTAVFLAWALPLTLLLTGRAVAPEKLTPVVTRMRRSFDRAFPSLTALACPAAGGRGNTSDELRA